MGIKSGVSHTGPQRAVGIPQGERERETALVLKYTQILMGLVSDTLCCLCLPLYILLTKATLLPRGTHGCLFQGIRGQ